MNTKSFFIGSKYHQQGAATLLVTVVMLILLTISALTVSNLTTTELKVSSNLNRAKEAFYAAQAGLDEASLRHLNDTTASVTNETGSVASGTYSYDLNPSGVITSRGFSLDGGGAATLHQTVSVSETIDYGTTVPILAVGNIPTGGSFTIVANPNGGGEGVPVSALSKSAGTNGVASWQSCEYDEYLAGVCDERVLCEEDESGCEDFVTSDCPADPFETIFGEEIGVCVNGAWQDTYPEVISTYRDGYSGLITCDDLDDPAKLTAALEIAKATGPRGLPALWIKENSECSIPSIGSSTVPLILVIEGNAKINAGVDFGGILFSFTDTYNGVSTPNELSMNGGATINGGLATNGTILQVNGSATVAYSPEILSKLTEVASESKGLIKQVGTWRDFE